MGRSMLGARAAVAAVFGLTCCGPLAVFAQVPPTNERPAIQLAQNPPAAPRVARNLAPEGRDDDLATDGVFLPPDQPEENAWSARRNDTHDGAPE